MNRTLIGAIAAYMFVAMGCAEPKDPCLKARELLAEGATYLANSEMWRSRAQVYVNSLKYYRDLFSDSTLDRITEQGVVLDSTSLADLRKKFVVNAENALEQMGAYNDSAAVLFPEVIRNIYACRPEQPQNLFASTEIL